jgi:DNA-directed RNA polymerase beta' subunit
MTCEIQSVQFGIMSDADIVAISACVIDKATLTIEPGSVYDLRMGCVQNDSICETCCGTIWTCPGHFGHIELNVPIILFYKQCCSFLKCVCLHCCRLLVTKRELELNCVTGYDNCLAFVSNVSTCSHCKTPAPEIRLAIADATISAQHKLKNSKAVKELTPAFIKTVLDTIPDEDVQLLGLDTAMYQPKNLVLTKLPIVPTCCRPRMVTPDNISDDDLTLMLIDIIKSNNFIRAHPYDEKDCDAYNKAVSMIKYRALSYCDNSRGRATHNTNHKPMTGIKERINKKTGIVRQNLTGKRCDRTARTVIGPDPTLELDQVAIPPEIANTLTIPEYVTPMSLDRLTLLVNSGRASTVIKTSANNLKEPVKINVAHARIKRGTILRHTDIIIRNGVEIPVTNCKKILLATDKIKKVDGTIIDVVPNHFRHVELNIGDKVERYLSTGDAIYLNRQPTLHRNSMLGMKVVVKPGKTIRFNLSITKGLNADFDGDEGNIFCCETLESTAELNEIVNAKAHMLSAQTNKPEMVIVQDSLLAAYLMTRTPVQMSKCNFMNCLMRTNALDNAAYVDRGNDLFASDLFEYILPRDFHITYSAPSNLEIKNGKIVAGYFDKTVLGSTPNAIIRLLCLEYGNETAAKFIDNLQFLTNAWLEIYPFSIGIDDCLIGDCSQLIEIKRTIYKYFLEADAVHKSTSNKRVREARTNLALNKAKDIGLRIAKDALKPTNNCVSTVTSGSKGDFFNIAQITGLLGQQNLSNQRPTPTLTNNTRTLVHYPAVILDTTRKYESRGFVSSSFIGGLNPKEMWFHAMTGREGMINTAMKTARSGYIQRSCVKLGEDLKIEYDGTVRDASKNIYQFAYGNHGYDPCNVSFGGASVNNVYPVNIKRLCARLNVDSARLRKLTRDEIDDIVSRCKWNCQIDRALYDDIWTKHESLLVAQLETVELSSDKYLQFKAILVEKYHTARAIPGECVGILSAQSIGELQTQSNLNTFHTAGKLQTSGVDRFEEILNMTKTVKSPTMTIYFKQRYRTAIDLREAIGCSIVGATLKNVMAGYEPESLPCSRQYKYILRYRLRQSRLFSLLLDPETICDAISAMYTDCECECESLAIIVKIGVSSDDDSDIANISAKLEKILLCGFAGITAMHLDKSDDDEFYIITEGSNLKKALGHPLIDVKRLYTNDIWETYECFGICATRKMLFDDIKKVVKGVNDVHVKLLVDKMTIKGRPMSITRYTMRTNNVGPLSKATFEQSVDILLSAAFKSEKDVINGVSAAIVSGNQPRIGTGLPEMLIDFESLITCEASEIRDTYY